MNILVMGSLDTTNENCAEFLQFFAAEIVGNGHKLLNGNRNEMDKVLAGNMNKLLLEKGLDFNDAAYDLMVLPKQVKNIDTALLCKIIGIDLNPLCEG